MELNKYKNSCVIVLGDMGRSPRMCNHVNMLSKNKQNQVTFIGYNEKQVHKDILKPNVKQESLNLLLLKIIKLLPTILYYFLKITIENL